LDTALSKVTNLCDEGELAPKAVGSNLTRGRMMNNLYGWTEPRTRAEAIEMLRDAMAKCRASAKAADHAAANLLALVMTYLHRIES
jgi:hypothetical protein